MPSRDVLLIDAGSHPLQALAGRMQRIGFRALRVKTPEAAEDVLKDERFSIRGVVVPPDLAVANLAGALERLSSCVADGRLRFVAAGPSPSEEARERLRDARVELALFGETDRHALRFVLNRACADHDPVVKERGALRAPADLPAHVRAAGREKAAQVYSISPRGAFLATERPSMRQALVHLSLPLPDGTVATTARVVMTNVPGNLVRRNLPLGMGVCFTGAAGELEAALEAYVEHRLARLRP